MAKQEIKQRETQVSTNEGDVGKQLEQTYTVDESFLPSPQELEEYKRIDPRIVDLLLDSSRKEQEHRHRIESEKIKIIKSTERRDTRINWWGMFFACFCIVVLSGVTAYALYLDRLWFAGIMGGATIVSIASIFIRRDTPDDNKRKRKK
jgi:uncharacterized membrane protein